MAEKQNAPEIRFEGFTDPWEQRKLGEFSKKITTKNADGGLSETFTNSAEQGVISQLDYFDHNITNDANISGYYVVQPDNFVYNPRISVTAPCGPINRNRLNRAGVMSPLYTVFSVDGSMDKTYLEHYFKTSRWHDFMFLEGNSGARSDRFSISDATFFEMPIWCPKIPEQRAIAKQLETMDSLITLHQRKHDKLCTVKRSMLDKMFPKLGDTEPEIRFKGFTDPWEQRKFSDIADVCSGKDYKHLKEGPIPVYGTGGFMTSVDEALSYDRDAVGIGRKGTIDKPYLLKAPFWTVDTLFYAIPKEDMDLEFIHCSFLNVDWKTKDESTGLPSLSKEAINETIALVPSFNEQSRLGEFFNNLDSLITLHQRKLDLLKNTKKSLLDKMFV